MSTRTNVLPLENGKLVQRSKRPCDHAEPPPADFFFARFLVRGFMNLIFGHGGTGKSIFVAALMIYACLGRFFLGLRTRKVSTLWIDADGMGDENVRRLYSLSRGIGLEKPPANFYHYELEGPLTTQEAIAQVQFEIEAIRAEHPEDDVVTVIDSASGASYTADGSSGNEMTAVFRKWHAAFGTVIVLDHVSKASLANGKASNPLGTVMKHNLVRSSMELTRSDRGGMALSHEKYSFSSAEPTLYFAADFTTRADGKDVIRFSGLHADDERAPGREHTAADRVLEVLDAGGDLTARQIAVASGITLQTVRNRLSDLRDAGKVDSPRRGTWRTVRKDN